MIIVEKRKQMNEGYKDDGESDGDEEEVFVNENES